VDESIVMLDSAVEKEEEREGNSGSGRGDRHIGDGDASLSGVVSTTSCVVSASSSRAVSVSGGVYFSGSGGTSRLESQSGHAPGKDGVGEAASIVLALVLAEEKERRKRRRKGSHRRRELLDK
jgi:hypothetical protein